MSLLKTLPLLAFTLCARPALADVVTYNISTDGLETPFADALKLPRFDDGLGDLMSVQIRISTQFDVNVSAENLAPVPQILTVDAAVFGALLDSKGQTLHTEAPYATDILLLDAYDGALDAAGPSGFRDQLFSYSASAVIDIPASDFDTFTGTGPALQYQAEDDSSIASDVGNVISDLDIEVGLRVQLIYRYSPPAPSGLPALQTAQADPVGAFREPDAPALA